MAAVCDEYDYLERQVDAQRGEPAPTGDLPARGKSFPGTASDDDNNRRRRSRSTSRARRSSRKSSRTSRSRSRDRRRSRSRSRDRSRSRSYSDRHYRSSYRSPPRRRSPTPPAERLAREKERELRDLERATRTVFAYNLNLRVDERDLFEFFSKVGRVADIRLITDRNTKKSRGLAYIEFSKVEEVISAVALTGNLLKGQPVLVKASEAEKNMAWEAAQQQKHSAQQLLSSLSSSSSAGGHAAAADAAAITAAGGPCWLHVANLHRDLGEPEIQQLFVPFGTLNAVTVVRDPATGRATGSAFLQYSQMDAAAHAMAHWHGRKLMDATLAVTASPPPQTVLPTLPLAAAAAGLPPGVLPGALPAAAAALPAVALPGGAGAAAAVLPAAVAPSVGTAAAPAAQQGAVITTGELDEDEEGGGIKMSAQSRVALMTKLAGAAGLPPPPTHIGPVGLPPGTVAVTAVQAAAPALAVDPVLLIQQGVLGPSSPIPTPCLLLKNMFDPATAAGDSAALAAEVEADVREECARFGELVHIWVDPKSRGFVYLRFAAVQSAEAAHRALHGRWYGGKQIIAEYQFLQVYNAHFKLQAK